MSHRVRFHADFRADLRSHLRWLGENVDDPWTLRLRAGLDEAVALVTRFPDVGNIDARQGTTVLRRLILRKVPYVIWFVRDTAAPDADIWFLRLFHARQARPVAGTALPAQRPPRKR